MTRSPAPTSPSERSPLAHQRGSAVTWFLAIIVLGGVAFAVYWFALRKEGGASASLAGRVLPAEVDLVGGLDIARLVADPNVREAAKRNGGDIASIEAELEKAGVKLSDLKSLVFGGRIGDMQIKDLIVAIEANTDAKALVGVLQGIMTQLPDSATRVLAGGRVEALDGGVVLTGSGELLDLAMAVSKGAGAALGSKADLDEVREALDAGAVAWVASPIPPEALAMLPGAFTSQIGGTPTHFGFSAGLRDGAELRAALLIPGADAAQVASSLKFLVGMLKSQFEGAQRAILDKVELSGNGPVLIAKVALSASQLDAIMKRAQ